MVGSVPLLNIFDTITARGVMFASNQQLKSFNTPDKFYPTNYFCISVDSRVFGSRINHQYYNSCTKFKINVQELLTIGLAGIVYSQVFLFQKSTTRDLPFVSSDGRWKRITSQ